MSKNNNLIVENRNRFLFFTFFYIILHLQGVSAQNADIYFIKKVVIDAGHGGKDPGALGKKSKEKDISLAIALQLGAYITANLPDVTVVYTRTTDVFVPLSERAKIANDARADCFISIHVNSSKKPQPYGTSTYVMGVHKTEDNIELATVENSVVVYENNYKTTYQGFDPNLPESYIVLSLYQNAYQNQSLLLASKIQKQFTERAGRKNLGVKQAGLVVLWMTTMPSVLVETGFISNANEENYLRSAQGQAYIASAIYRAFKEYKYEIERKSNGGVVSGNGTNNSNNNKTNNLASGDIRFMVQIKSSAEKIPLNSVQFKGFANISEIKVDGRYKYVTGNSKKYDEIVELQALVRKTFPDAFVVAIKNGKTIPLKDALKILN